MTHHPTLKPIVILGTLVLATQAFTVTTTWADPPPPDRPKPTSARPLAPTTLPATNPAAAPALLSWHAKLQDGIDDAQRRNQPVLVEVGAVWCGWCRKLEGEVAKPAVQTKLASWARVRLDMDRDVDAVRGLAVGPIPALRVLSPMGRVVASHDGYLSGDDLIKWLDQHYKTAAAAGEAIGDEPGDPAAAEALVARITDADAVVREAVTRRLLRRPDVAAGKVVDAFATGKLSARLALLELLHEWRAPLDKIDPWEPSSITPERLDKLKKWADEAAKAGPATQPAATALDSAALAAARRDLAVFVAATTDGEARAARERLARLGMGLMPEVYAALKAAATDRDRERLTSLRYRLAASDALALAWPHGFDRLAAGEAQERHAALEELRGRATALDAPLMLELFSDPDPLVREGSLRLLQGIGGAGTTAGLVKLLRDPELNVRAAVLKQLAEAPVPGMDAEVIKFLATETDPDLIVHAVRVLREAKTRPAREALLGLLAHASWRVRAEAAESLGKLVADRTFSASEEQKADIYAAMIRLLDDADGFVVSRAVMVLRDGAVAAAVEPMVKAAEKRPELAPDVVKALARGNNVGGANQHLRKFCAHADPNVRAVAVTAWVSVGLGGAADEMRMGLQDTVPRVRVASATALLNVLKRERPDPNNRPTGFIPLGQAGGTPDLEKWLADFRGGKLRPEWAGQMIEPLEKMLDATAEERLAAAVPLVALGRDARAMPVLDEAAAKGDALGRGAAASGLPWIPWDKRVAMFNALVARASHDELGTLLQEMLALPNSAAADLLWPVVGSDKADVAIAAAVETALLELYLGERYYNPSEVPPARLKSLVDAATKKLDSGSDMQRLVALALLASAAPQQAVAPAEKLIKERPSGNPLRADGLQVVLLSKEKAEADASAVAVLGGANDADWEMKKVALRYLAKGPAAMRQLRGTIYLNNSSTVYSSGDGTAVTVVAPKGLTAEMLKPMLTDSDRANAAMAGYLACLLGDRAGFDPLVGYWREHARSDVNWWRLVYRAVAVLDDDGLVPVLEEVYKAMGDQRDSYAREFYWTIRPMNGPNILKLRKQVRDDVGMLRLR